MGKVRIGISFFFVVSVMASTPLLVAEEGVASRSSEVGSVEEGIGFTFENARLVTVIKLV